MTRNEAQSIAKEAVAMALRDIGIDAQEWQEIRKDFLWTRQSRVRCESILSKVVAWGVITVISAASLLSFEGFLSRIGKDIL